MARLNATPMAQLVLPLLYLCELDATITTRGTISADKMRC